MSYAMQMLGSFPDDVRLDGDAGRLPATIDALSDCAQACATDTDADLSEPNLADMVTCIRLCQDCADICTATIRILSRAATSDTGLHEGLLEACAAGSSSCADECERHASMHEHCHVCAVACRRCEHACRDC